MTDLVAFLTARLAEAEAHARKDLYVIDRATPLEQWTAHYGYNLPYSLLGEDGSIGRITSSYGRVLADGEPDQHQADVMLVARLVRGSRRKAERALREVEALRAVVEEYESTMRWVEELRERGEPSEAYARHVGSLLGVLRTFAAIWSDHPDYQESWAA